ncbi:MAG TPA: hypothetical protein PLV06_14665 [Bacteroidales bacterium]|nr:hypothetical protein [Bacteroidales bacterium]
MIKKEHTETGLERLITSDVIQVTGDIGILDNFLKDFYQQPRLFYPSSNLDTRDVLFINGDRLSELGENSPFIYIHCDASCPSEFEYFRVDSQEPSLSINLVLGISKEEKRKIFIFKIHKPYSEDRLWLIYFAGYWNEDILKILIKDGVRVPVLYTTCDGITNGMGGYENSVPAILYPLLYDQLVIQCHIADQSNEDAKIIINGREPEIVRRWLNNIVLISRNPTVSELLKLNDTQMKNRLIDYLERYKETDVNNDKITRVYHPSRLYIRVIT